MRSRAEIEQLRSRMSSTALETLARVFRALSDEKRLLIVRVFLERQNLCVSELAGLLRISIPAASQHLRVLSGAQIIKRKRLGQSVCFEIARENKLVDVLSKVMKKYV